MSVSVAGVVILSNDRALSADFLRGAFSSLVRVPSLDVGVANPARFGEALGAVVDELDCTRGVCGLLVGFERSGIPSSASRSASDCGCP
jgi:hypothetical protein